MGNEIKSTLRELKMAYITKIAEKFGDIKNEHGDRLVDFLKKNKIRSKKAIGLAVPSYRAPKVGDGIYFIESKMGFLTNHGKTVKKILADFFKLSFEVKNDAPRDGIVGNHFLITGKIEE